MGANQSTQENVTIPRQLCEHGPIDGSTEKFACSTEGMKAEAAHEGRAYNGLEPKPSIESSNGSQGGNGLGGGHTPAYDKGLGSSHSPGIDTNLERSRDLQNAVSITGGHGTDGACLIVQPSTEQAASEDVRPRSQKGTWSMPSRTQSHIFGCPPQEEIPNFYLNNNIADPPSLHLLRSKPLQYDRSTSNRDNGADKKAACYDSKAQG